MKKKWSAWLLAAVLLVSGCGNQETKSSAGKDYYRITVLSDVHYPSKTPMSDAEKRAKKSKQKEEAIQEINQWNDLDLAVFTGDMVALSGEERQMKEFLTLSNRLDKPKAFIAGNHELFYEKNQKFSDLSHGVPQGYFLRDVENHIENFKKNFGPLYYTKEMGNYLLVFLSPDDNKQSKFPMKMSEEELDWFKKTVEANKNKPTIVFYHAPLDGTLTPKNEKEGNPREFAQPSAKIDLILLTNPQIKLWVSGHTHTPPTNPNFNSPVNYYHGKLLDLYNPTWEGKQVWTNSLYLYKDKIVVKTYDHKEHKWLDNLTRTIDVDDKK